MRCCDNCNYGKYALDCSTSIETLYCNLDEYEVEVQSDSVCEEHQYISGYEDEKNYIFYDDNYLGRGYFIINKKEDKIISFLKIFIMNDNSFPTFGIRSFNIEAKDNPDNEFNNIVFTFRNEEDFDNGLFDIFNNLSKNVNKIETVDKINQGNNHIILKSNNKIVKFIVAKDIYGVKYSSDFIDINIGDNDTCKCYDSILHFYNSLVELNVKTIEENEIKNILSLKL